ncbi:MAG: type IV pilin protein [Pseudomonadota bacterium]
MYSREARQPNRGFTLIELLIAVTIFAVIAAVAAPIYTEYTERGYRSEAQGDLLNCAQALERWNAVNFSYVGAVDDDGDGIADAGSTNGPLGNELCRPLSVTSQRYTINAALTQDTYLLTADPQVGPMSDDGFMTIDQMGQREWDEDDSNNIGADEDDWIDDDL